MDIDAEKFLTDLDELALMRVPNTPEYQITRNVVHYLLLIELEEVE